MLSTRLSSSDERPADRRGQGRQCRCSRTHYRRLPGGPRFDSSLSPESRSSEANGIWFCQNCAKLADNDLAKFPASVLREWKASAELNALARIGKAAGTTVDLSLSSAEIELLHAAVRDGDIWLLSGTRGTRVHTGDRDFRSEGDPSLEAGYLDALEALTRQSLARRIGDTHFKLTGKGFRVARELEGGVNAGDMARRPTVTRRRRKRSIGQAWSDRPTKPHLIENISASGAFLQTDGPINKGEVLPLELALDDGSKIKVTRKWFEFSIQIGVAWEVLELLSGRFTKGVWRSWKSGSARNWIHRSRGGRGGVESVESSENY